MRTSVHYASDHRTATRTFRSAAAACRWIDTAQPTIQGIDYYPWEASAILKDAYLILTRAELGEIRESGNTHQYVSGMGRLENTSHTQERQTWKPSTLLQHHASRHS